MDDARYDAPYSSTASGDDDFSLEPTPSARTAAAAPVAVGGTHERQQVLQFHGAIDLTRGSLPKKSWF